MKKSILLTGLVLCLAFLTSCVSTGLKKRPCSEVLTERGVKNCKQLCSFFLENNPALEKKYILNLAKLYVKEASYEGINSDCAFVQMCLETGFLRFGNLVTKDMNNFCGLGSIDASHPGEKFESEQEGVRAHIQHLHAYATTSDVKLKNECIDKRYKYVNPRGKAPTIYELSGTWASDKGYGEKLKKLLSKLDNF